MNLVIVNHYAGNPGLGMEFRPYYLAKEWVRQGHQVVIVGGSYSHLRVKQPAVTGDFSEEFYEGIRYVWIRTNTYSGNGLGRIRSMGQFVAGLYKHLGRILENFSPDLIIASSTYPLDNFPLKKISKRLGAKLCYEVHDLWPLSPMELGGYSRYHPFIMVMQLGEDYGYRHADFVVSMLPKTRDYMVSRGLHPDKFFYVPNGISLEEWEGPPKELPREHRDLLSSLKQQFGFLVGYTGGHSISNSLYTLVNAGKFLRDRAAIVLVGDGIEKQGLQTVTASDKIDNVFFLPPVPKSCIPGLLQSFDALFIGAPKQSLYRFGISPNKMFDYMMAAKPIIQAIEAGNNMVEEHSCGISVEPENSAAVADAIIKLMTMTASDRKQMGVNGREAALSFYNYSILAKKFLEATETIK